MSHPSLPPAGIAAARAEAARAQPSHRLAEDAVRAQPERIASRQIAAPAPMPAPAQSGRIERAIADASRRTGVDFDFLVAQARIESAMDPEARATTSSASGLYQFIESTWLSTMQRHGARFGLGDVAARIARAPGGEAHVADPAERRAILAMRRDPEIAALMAAGLAEDNAAHLAPVLGRAPDHSELYLAHFLGAGGAARFLTEMARDPGQGAASLFRRPAAANPAIFFDAGGRERSLAEVMDRLAAKVERARALAPDMPMVPPYLIADEAAFGPGDPPALTGTSRPVIAPRAVLGMATPPSPPPPGPPQRPPQTPPMSRVLSATLEGLAGRAGDAPAIDRASESIRAAYERLKAMGL
ncbi:lytic transglycosylase domain-containing protein [Erythrobacter sp.]|uniref:lytic transglycosylase domain-containing protein n=1 Tax=Erythrobacter sp. TaxID=1042 RepID=UPI001425D60D|nr:lytic transglycosylase domain-containing protein [Erythrobacter sp.]QIQ87158.1 MAG: lytic transglycosylase domain-containing protein [Erythrobacter sp.]